MNMTKKRLCLYMVSALLMLATSAFATESTKKLDAVTESGDKVTLFPDGHLGVY